MHLWHTLPYFPLFSLLITIGVFLQIDLTDQLYTQIEPVVGPKVVEALRSIIENATEADVSSFATIISVGVTIFSATTVFAEIQSSLNTIWGIKAVPRKSWLKYIKNRLLSFSVILVFAFILLITFTITNLITDLSNRYIANNPDVADAKIKSKDVFIGAVVTTVLLLAGQWGISFYIAIANIETVYGAAAFMAIFIIWIYYSAIIIYTGAEFTKAWANELGGKIFPDEYAVATKIIEIHEEKKSLT